MTQTVTDRNTQSDSMMADYAIVADWRDFIALTKPGVLRLVVFTGLAGLLAAPGSINPIIGFTAILCITLAAAGAATLNQWYEADIDGIMKRTSKRPLPSGRMDRTSALHFGIGLSALSVFLMGVAVNWLAAGILAFSIFFYAVIYTMWLKPNTPHNIVIGGAAGAFPPVIGWAAVTGDVTALPIILFAIIFIWTPPHFWALALFVEADYSKAGIPMLPVTHGKAETRKQMLGYSVLLLLVTILPWPLGLTGALYGLFATGLSAFFLVLAVQVFRAKQDDAKKMRYEKKLFAYSIIYLFVIFGVLVADRILLGGA
ncbi:heme o synthase [Parasphingorhabdus sp. DH2-15]|uniref:heme o synthase n=1 Tax=Parasphingorhabdus sp. DH2-15 TaxID=3444112 RepID=UPI003F688205